LLKLYVIQSCCKTPSSVNSLDPNEKFDWRKTDTCDSCLNHDKHVERFGFEIGHACQLLFPISVVQHSIVGGEMGAAVWKRSKARGRGPYIDRVEI
jgi:hypothetical protein